MHDDKLREHPRAWTQASQEAYERISETARGMDGGVRARILYLRTLACEALKARRPDHLVAVLRTADETTDDNDALRFRCAVCAMRRRDWASAAAAWDDAGRCWAGDAGNEDGGEDDESQVHTPDRDEFRSIMDDGDLTSAKAAAAMRDACMMLNEALAEISSRDLADGVMKAL